MSMTVMTRISLVLLAFTNVHCRNEFLAKAAGIPPKPALPPPRDFAAVADSATHINLSWKKPDVPGALTAYDISYQIRNGTIIKRETPGNLSIYRVDGLTPWTNYTFSIQARNNTNSSAPVTANETTLMAAPSKISSYSFKAGAHRVEINWEKPDRPNGPIFGYNVTFPGGHVFVTNMSFAKYNLTQNVTYTFTVAGINRDPRQSLKNLTAEETVIKITTYSKPLPPPRDFVAVASSATRVNLSWKKPDLPGPITAYDISCQIPNGTIIKYEVPGSLSNYTVDGLAPWTNYRFEIQSRNNTNSSVPISTREVTFMTAPSRIPSWSFSVRRNSVEINWKEPNPANGPISGYIVTFPGGNKVTPLTYFRKNDLKEHTLYTFTIAGFNRETRQKPEDLTGEEIVINAQTPWPSPSVREIRYRNSTRNTIQFSYSRPLFTPTFEPIIQYLLLVTAGDDLSKNIESRIEELKTFKSWKESRDSSEVYRSSPVGWSPETESNICKRNGGSFVCTVGGQEKCGNEQYCNGPLRKNTTYRVKVRAYTETGWIETAAVEAKTNGGIQVTPVATGLILFSIMFVMFDYS